LRRWKTEQLREPFLFSFHDIYKLNKLNLHNNVQCIVYIDTVIDHLEKD